MILFGRFFVSASTSIQIKPTIRTEMMNLYVLPNFISLLTLLLTLNSSLFTPSPHININLQPSHLHVHAPTRQIRLECYLRLSEKIIRIHLRHRVMRRVWRNDPAVGTTLGFIGNPYSYLPVGHPLRLYGDLIYLFQPPRVANIQQRRRNTPLDLFTKNAFVMVERHHPVKRAQQQSSINIINRKRGIILRLPLVPL